LLKKKLTRLLKRKLIEVLKLINLRKKEPIEPTRKLREMLKRMQID